jgi:hypothetical protein
MSEYLCNRECVKNYNKEKEQQNGAQCGAELPRTMQKKVRFSVAKLQTECVKQHPQLRDKKWSAAMFAELVIKLLKN